MSKKKSDKELKNKKKVNKTEKVKKPYKKKRVMFISSEGGHMSELQQLEFEKYDYSVVTEKTETTIGLTKKYGDKIHYLKYGTRHRPLRYIYVCIANIIKSIKLYHKILLNIGQRNFTPRTQRSTSSSSSNNMWRYTWSIF